MTTGYLVNPDLSRRLVEFSHESAGEALGIQEGGPQISRLRVAFQEDGASFEALFNPRAKAEGAEPNPVASLARNHAETGNSAFLQDPIRAICGPVIFVVPGGEGCAPGSEGPAAEQPLVAAVEHGIRAVQNYRADQPEEFALWRAAARNSHRNC